MNNSSVEFILTRELLSASSTARSSLNVEEHEMDCSGQVLLIFH